MFARELLESVTEFVAPYAKRTVLEIAAPFALIGAAVLIVAKAVDYHAHADERRAHQARLEKIRQQQAKLNAAPQSKPSTQTHVVATKALPQIVSAPVQDSYSPSHSSAYNRPSYYSYGPSTNQLNRQHKVAKINAELEQRNKILEIQANARKRRQG